MLFVTSCVAIVGLCGATVSIERESGAEGELRFPAVSVSVTVIFQVPSESSASVHAPEDIAQETLGNPERVAVTLIAPTTVPETLNVGVASFVISSLFETPKSDAAAKSGVAWVEKDRLLITTLPSAVLASELTPPPD